VAVIPLVENPGAVFAPRAELFVLDAERRVVAGPLVLARRRAYHREWLLGFHGVTTRSAVEGWRDHLVGIAGSGTDDADG
jgi:hypothetical protein